MRLTILAIFLILLPNPAKSYQARIRPFSVKKAEYRVKLWQERWQPIIAGESLPEKRSEHRAVELAVLELMAEDLKRNLAGKTQDELEQFWFSEPEEQMLNETRLGDSTSWAGLTFLLEKPAYQPFFAYHRSADGYSHVTVSPVWRDAKASEDHLIRSYHGRIQHFAFVGVVVRVESHGANVGVASRWVGNQVSAKWVLALEDKEQSEGLLIPEGQHLFFAGGKYRTWRFN